MRPIARFAWGVLACDIAVVAWGAFVRATGSGAGCGQHWPTCNGEVFPRTGRMETLVEWSHRLSSGGVMVLTLTLAVWAFRAFARGHRVRRAAATSVALIAAEALIGAGLVRFALVAHDASAARALVISIHLVNTFLLLAATATTAWWASGGAPVRLRGQGAVLGLLAVPMAAMLAVGATGAVTALGDTLFPSTSLVAGLAADAAQGAPLLVRLRVIHPALAACTAGAVVVALGWVRALRPTRTVILLSRAAAAMAVAQVAAGLLDVVTAAPIAMQIVHLAMADLVWIALVLSGAAALAVAPEPAASQPSYSQRASHVS